MEFTFHLEKTTRGLRWKVKDELGETVLRAEGCHRKLADLNHRLKELGFASPLIRNNDEAFNNAIIGYRGQWEIKYLPGQQPTEPSKEQVAPFQLVVARSSGDYLWAIRHSSGGFNMQVVKSLPALYERLNKEEIGLTHRVKELLKKIRPGGRCNINLALTAY